MENKISGEIAKQQAERRGQNTPNVNSGYLYERVQRGKKAPGFSRGECQSDLYTHNRI